ncbi:MAG: FAD:protein FMN transferase [Arenicella sp.]
MGIAKVSEKVSMFLPLSLSVLLGACSVEPELIRFNGPIMGTQYNVTLACDTDKPLSYWQSLSVKAMERVNQSMSTYIPASELSQFNSYKGSDWQTVSSDLLAVVEIAQQVSVMTSGALDVTVAPLVDLWGFGPSRNKQLDAMPVPTQEQLRAVESYIGHRKIVLDKPQQRWQKKEPELMVDLSAVAKGYAVDLVAANLQEQGCNDFLVDIGGELKASGKNLQGKNWRIAIEKPQLGSNIQEMLSLSNVGVASSGDYRNFYWHKGKRLSHTIDPRSLRPVEHTLASVTVVHTDTAKADALATAFMVMGDTAVDLAQKNGLAAYFIFRKQDSDQKGSELDYRIVTTKEFEKYQVRK